MISSAPARLCILSSYIKSILHMYYTWSHVALVCDLYTCVLCGSLIHDIVWMRLAREWFHLWTWGGPVWWPNWSLHFIYTQIRLTGVMDGSPCRVRSELCQWIYLSLKQDEKTLQCTCLAKYTKEFHSLPKYYQQIKRLNLLLPKEFLLFVGLFFLLAFTKD